MARRKKNIGGKKKRRQKERRRKESRGEVLRGEKVENRDRFIALTSNNSNIEDHLLRRRLDD